CLGPDVNDVALQLSFLPTAKLARNNAKYQGKPWPLTMPYTVSDGVNKVTIVGQPDLSRLTTVMLGVRNPLKSPSNTSNDDGADKNGEVWFDELRLTNFDDKGGWAATGRL